jgi:hypothetical protein
LFDQDGVNDSEAAFLKPQDAHRRDLAIRALRHPLQVPEGMGCHLDLHGFAPCGIDVDGASNDAPARLLTLHFSLDSFAIPASMRA